MSMYPDLSPDLQRAALSALMDGDNSATDEACRAWRGDASARADWHAYHLIGDLMRSDEHRADEAGDARFLTAVRTRLAAEPVVLAPTPAAKTPLPRARNARRWLAPTAVAAGFVAVAGALMVTRVATPESATTPVVAEATTPLRGPVATSVASPAGPVPQVAVEAAAMIRSAELDRYLAAHRQYANGATQVVPGGAVRNAAATAPGR
jgi:sigma-E factor negative regulatory protein RseA